MAQSEDEMKSKNAGLSIRAFVSHSHEDRLIAESLISVLENALQLVDGELRCTSVPGYGIPNRELIADRLKNDLDGSMILFALLSEEALESTWIKFELGAAWVKNKEIVTVLGPGINADDSRLGPLRGISHVAIESINPEEQLRTAVYEAGVSIGRQRGFTAVTEKHIAAFVKCFRELGGAVADFSSIEAKFQSPPTSTGHEPALIAGEVSLKGHFAPGWDGFFWLVILNSNNGQIWPKVSFDSKEGVFPFQFEERGALGRNGLGVALIGCGRSGNRRILNWLEIGEQTGSYQTLKLSDLPGREELDFSQDF